MASHFQRFLYFLILIIIWAGSADSDEKNRHFCGSTGNFTSGDTYESNLETVRANTTNNIVDYGFYNFSFGESPNTVYEIALCRGDLEPMVCSISIGLAGLSLKQLCPVQKEAIAWTEDCMVRYSNRPIFGLTDITEGVYWKTGSELTSNTSTINRFSKVVGSLLGELKTRAALGDSKRKFAFGHTADSDIGTIYGLAQCTPDQSQANCTYCLDFVIGSVPKYLLGWDGGTLMYPSCFIRYEIYRFYDLSADVALPPQAQLQPSPPISPQSAKSAPPMSPPSAPLLLPPSLSSPPPPPLHPPLPDERNHGKLRPRIIIIAGVAAATGLLILSVVFYIFCFKWRRFREDVVKENVDDEIIASIESLQFDLRTIKTATNNFSEENKLGEGGFGVVYKGRLENGQDIAVKTLLIDSVHGDEQFRTEAILVAKLQHRNLVKLIGFCLVEKLLIYEYVPNKSLDHFLFDSSKRILLDWETRYRIIVGVARGLNYLHQDSRLRIVHRDLKASNILLDEELNPKIADFGLARLFSADQTQAATTKIIGTYGYMAPEYAMHGHFSAKSDVYSFGVLTLEIISGHRNTSFLIGEKPTDLLSLAWRYWSEGAMLNLMDPILSGSAEADILRCLHIGLLCVQEDIVERPPMTEVVTMLINHSSAIPIPAHC